jgi:hypothetical protein
VTTDVGATDLAAAGVAAATVTATATATVAGRDNRSRERDNRRDGPKPERTGERHDCTSRAEPAWEVSVLLEWASCGTAGQLSYSTLKLRTPAQHRCGKSRSSGD